MKCEICGKRFWPWSHRLQKHKYSESIYCDANWTVKQVYRVCDTCVEKSHRFHTEMLEESKRKFDQALEKARPTYYEWLQKAPISSAMIHKAPERRWPNYWDFQQTGNMFLQMLSQSELLEELCYAVTVNSGGPWRERPPMVDLEKQYGPNNSPLTYEKVLSRRVLDNDPLVDHNSRILKGSVYSGLDGQMMIQWHELSWEKTVIR